jgi:hypothetical protein
MPSLDFDGKSVLKSMYDAIEERRNERGMSWAEVAHEVNRIETKGKPEGHPVAASTITSLKDKPVGEGDGILGILTWLGRTPESFIPGFPDAMAERYRLPDVERNHCLRWDTQALHAALNNLRQARRMTWREVAEEQGGCTPSMLTHLAKGGRIGFPFPAMRIVLWLDQPAANFVRAADGSVWADTGELRPEAMRNFSRLKKNS